MAAGRRCPECSIPAWTGVAGGFVGFADEHWIRSLHKAAEAIALGGVAVLAGGTVSGLAGWLLDNPQVQLVVMATSVGILALTIFVGWMLFTAPEPAVAPTESHRSPRRMARAGALATVYGTLAGVILPRLGVNPSIGYTIYVLASPPGVSGAIALWCFPRYVEEVSDRSLSPFCAGRARGYRKIFLVSWLIAVAGLAAFLLVDKLFVLVIALAAPVALICAILILLLPIYLTKHLQSARAVAAQFRAQLTTNNPAPGETPRIDAPPSSRESC